MDWISLTHRAEMRREADLVGIEPTTSSMPWKSQNSILLTAKALKDGRVGKDR